MDEINKLNEKYKFYDIHNISYRVELNSLEKYQKYDTAKKILQSIENNEYGIKNELQNILINRKNYSTYSKEFDLLIDKMKSDCFNDNISKLGFYLKKAIYKLKKKKAALDFNVNIVVSYTSPKGRNHYENNFNYNYDQLVKIALNNQKNVIQEKTYNSQIYATKKENHYIQCIHCDKLIDLNSIYCTYCGKKQTETEKNICYEQNKNNNNSNVTNLYGYKDTHNKTFLQAFDDNIFLNKKIDKSDEKIKENNNLENNEKHNLINQNQKNGLTNDNTNFMKLVDSLTEEIEKDNETEKIFVPKTKKEKVKSNISKIDDNIYDKFFEHVRQLYIRELDKPIVIKTDEGNKIIEQVCDYVNAHTKGKVYNEDREQYLNYFKNKYYEKNIHGYKIIDVKLEPEDLYPYKPFESDINFYCKCKKCERIMKQTANSFLTNPIECKCNILNQCDYSKIKDGIKIKQLDDKWDKELIPFKQRFVISLEKKDFCDISMDDYPKLYFKECEQFYRIGFKKIVKFNNSPKRKYIIGTFLLYNLNSHYIQFENVYYSISDPKFNPLLFYKEGDNYKRIDISKNNINIIDIEKLNNYIFIYFEKNDLCDNFKMNIINNNEEIIVTNIGEYSKYDILFDNWIYFDFQFEYYYRDKKIKGVKKNTEFRYQIYNMQENKLEKSEQNLNSQTFYCQNTDIIIDESKLTGTIKEILGSIKYVSNKKYKRVYFQKTAYEESHVLFEYLNNKYKINKLENEFEDDKLENYNIDISRENKKEIEFIEHITLRKNKKSFNYRIYSHSIKSIAHLILNNSDVRWKIFNLIDNDNLIIVKEKYKKDNILEKISYTELFEDYNGTYELVKEKLKTKYNVDDFELFLIILKKYGEEIAFGLEDTEYFDKKSEQYHLKEKYDEYETKYNKIKNKYSITDNKWKSEYTLYLLIKSYFPDAIYQYRFEELEQQILDIFVPTINIAFEYQGQQHYEPVERFGGEEHFKIQVELDEKKRKICNENNIILIEWSYQEKINKLELDKQLEKYKNIVETYYEFTKFE